MNLKRFILALTAVAMFAAIMASNASATMKTGGEWYVNNVTLAEGTKEQVTCEVGEHAGVKSLTLTGTVGTTPVKLTAKGIDCKEAYIFNEGGAGKDSGRLLFTEVSVMEPTGCTVAGGQVTTEPLKSELYMEEGVAGKAFDKFEPATAGGNFATVTIEGSCAAAGNRIVKGTVFGEATNATGVTAVNQPITFSPEIETTTGSELKFAGNPAHLTGQVINFLQSGNSWKAE